MRSIRYGDTLQINWESIFGINNVLTQTGVDLLTDLCQLFPPESAESLLDTFFKAGYTSLSTLRKNVIIQTEIPNSLISNLCLSTIFNRYTYGFDLLCERLKTHPSTISQNAYAQALVAAILTDNAAFFARILQIVKHHENKATILNATFSMEGYKQTPVSIPNKTKLFKDKYTLFTLAAEIGNQAILDQLLSLSTEDMQSSPTALQAQYVSTLQMIMPGLQDENILIELRNYCHLLNEKACNALIKITLALISLADLYAEQDLGFKIESEQLLAMLYNVLHIQGKHPEALSTAEKLMAYFPITSTHIKTALTYGRITHLCKMLEKFDTHALSTMLEQLPEYTYRLLDDDGWVKGRFGSSNVLTCALSGSSTSHKQLRKMLLNKLKQVSPAAILRSITPFGFNKQQPFVLNWLVLEDAQRRLNYFDDATVIVDTRVHDTLKLIRRMNTATQQQLFQQWYLDSDMVRYKKAEIQLAAATANGYSYHVVPLDGYTSIAAKNNLDAIHAAYQLPERFTPGGTRMNKFWVGSVENAKQDMQDEIAAMHSATDLACFLSYLDILFCWMDTEDKIIDRHFLQTRKVFILKAIQGVLTLAKNFQTDVIETYSPAAFSNPHEFMNHLFRFASIAHVTLQELSTALSIDLLALIKTLNATDASADTTLAKEVYTLLSRPKSVSPAFIELLARHEKLKEAVLEHIKTLADNPDYLTILQDARQTQTTQLYAFFATQRGIKAASAAAGVFGELDAEYNRVQDALKKQETEKSVNEAKAALCARIDASSQMLNESERRILLAFKCVIGQTIYLDVIEKLTGVMDNAFAFLVTSQSLPTTLTAENRDETQYIRDAVKTAYNLLRAHLATLEIKKDELVGTLDGVAWIETYASAQTIAVLQQFTQCIEQHCEALRSRLVYVEPPVTRTVAPEELKSISRWRFPFGGRRGETDPRDGNAQELLPKQTVTN